MIELAKKKIQEEITKSKDGNLQTIGNYLLQQIEINRDAAEKINNKDKTLSGAFKKVRDTFEKKAGNGCAMVDDADVYKIVREYFGFEAVQDRFIQVEVEEIKEDHNIEEIKSESNSNEFSVSLDDFM